MVKSIEDIQYFSGCIVDVFKNKPIGEKENNGYEWDFIRIFLHRYGGPEVLRSAICKLGHTKKASGVKLGEGEC